MCNSAIWLPWDKNFAFMHIPRTESSLWRVTGNLLKFTREYGGILVYREFNKRVWRYHSMSSPPGKKCSTWERPGNKANCRQSLNTA